MSKFGVERKLSYIGEGGADVAGLGDDGVGGGGHVAVHAVHHLLGQHVAAAVDHRVVERPRRPGVDQDHGRRRRGRGGLGGGDPPPPPPVTFSMAAGLINSLISYVVSIDGYYIW
jgi:hypothetical protein